MIVDSHAIGRNGTKRSCTQVTQLPPVVLSSRTVVQYHNQKIDIDTLHPPYLDFMILHEFKCVYLVPYNCIICLDLCGIGTINILKLVPSEGSG